MGSDAGSRPRCGPLAPDSRAVRAEKAIMEQLCFHLDVSGPPLASPEQGTETHAAVGVLGSPVPVYPGA